MKDRIIMALGMIAMAIVVLGMCYLGWKFQTFMLAIRFKVSLIIAVVLVAASVIYSLFSK